jgi:CHAT domain-containing protein
LRLSGLALAGANHRGQEAGGDDGILTAEEVAALDLRQAQWVVLSACETGVGEVTVGEGVLGLRSAFRIAGARTLIMSLWAVDDEATRQWMRALYENRLSRRLDTAASAREAALSVLRSRRASKRPGHPFYWASFVAAGDWR